MVSAGTMDIASRFKDLTYLFSSLDTTTFFLYISIGIIILGVTYILIRLKQQRPRDCLTIKIFDDRIQRIPENGQNMIYLIFWIRYTNNCSNPTTVKEWHIMHSRVESYHQVVDLELQPLQSEAIQYSQSIGVDKTRLRGILTVTHSHGRSTIRLPDYKWRLDTDDNILYP